MEILHGASGVLASAYGLGQMVGAVALIAIVGFAVRDRVRSRR